MSFLQVGFRFQYQLINLVWLSVDFLHLAEASLSCFSWLYALVCAVVQKFHEMSFIYNYSHFQYSIYNQSVELWNNNRNEHIILRNQNENKTKSRHI